VFSRQLYLSLGAVKTSFFMAFLFYGPQELCHPSRENLSEFYRAGVFSFYQQKLLLQLFRAHIGGGKLKRLVP
jgi:hypothetical protein